MEIIELTNISKSYGKTKAIKNASLTVNKGEIFGLVGPNGAGKTTLVKILTGQTKPDKGEVTVLKNNIVKHPVKAREKIGIIPEQETPPSFLNSEEYLQFCAQTRKLTNQTDNIREWLEFLEFKNEKNKLSKDLSRGTRQKLMISQAFFFKPEIVFIDEPLVNLDPLIQRKFKKYLRKYVKKGGTVFLCTHVLSMAEEVCDTVGFINEGNVIKTENVKKLLKQYKNLESAFMRIIK
ncbi:MAG: ABC transporter ATP-binding protein [Nanoarchaeota archaeon]|nr:ABC transporter ATP-binding protein [Nanoarchaeota archaeon]